MIQLVLTMITAYEKYGSDLNFNKSDIDNFISKYGLLKNLENCNERGFIVLWRNKYITDEKFARYMEINYEDKTFWLIADDFEKLLSENYEFEARVLDGSDDWWQHYDYYDVNVVPHWRDYTEETLKRIIKFCITKGIEINGELMTDENTKFNDGDIYFNNERLVDYINDSDLSDLSDILNSAICEAQDSGYQSEVYDSIKKSFVDKVGEFKLVTIEEKEKLYINLNNLKWNDIEDFLKTDYGEYDFGEETYGNLYYLLKQMDFFDFKKPNYEYLSGSIDNAILNEYTQNSYETSCFRN